MEDGNWQDGRSLADCNKYMLTNSVSTDVTFIVGEDKKEVRAHKYVLGSRSSVFYAMLFGPMAESTGTITIPDIEPGIFYEVLRFLYYEDVSITTTNITSLMLAADKYNVTGVVNKCEEYMKSTLTVDSVCEILNCAVLLNRDDLRKKCQSYISEHAYLVFQSSSFVHLHRENLKTILQSDDISIYEELIYESVIRWGESRCEEQGIEVSDLNVRNYLGDLIGLIRFPKMDIKYFASKISMANVLTPQEKVDVFQGHFIGNLGVETVNSPAKECYPRSDVCMRSPARTRDIQWNYKVDPDRLDFTVSNRVILLGFVMYAPGVPAKYDVEAQLIESSTALAVEKTVINTSHGEDTFRVMLKQGVWIKPGVKYTASVKMLGPQSYGCLNCSSTVTVDGLKWVFFNAAAPSNGTNVSKGQIPGFIFRRARRE